MLLRGRRRTPEGCLGGSAAQGNHEGVRQSGLPGDVQVVSAGTRTGGRKRVMVGRQAGAMELGFVLQVLGNQ